MNAKPLRRRPRLAALTLLCAAAPLAAGPAARGEDATPAPLDDAALVSLREEILPLPRELAWEAIDWTPAFGAGLLEADRLRKPVLLWVMNGHPLGCT